MHLQIIYDTYSFIITFNYTDTLPDFFCNAHNTEQNFSSVTALTKL